MDSEVPVPLNIYEWAGRQGRREVRVTPFCEAQYMFTKKKQPLCKSYHLPCSRFCCCVGTLAEAVYL